VKQVNGAGEFVWFRNKLMTSSVSLVVEYSDFVRMLGKQFLDLLDVGKKVGLLILPKIQHYK